MTQEGHVPETQAGAYLVLEKGGDQRYGIGLISEVREKILAENSTAAFQAPLNANSSTFQPIELLNLLDFSSPSKLSKCIWKAEERE